MVTNNKSRYQYNPALGDLLTIQPGNLLSVLETTVLFTDGISIVFRPA